MGSLKDWLASLPRLPEMRTCPRCGQYTPDLLDYWPAGSDVCRGCTRMDKRAPRQEYDPEGRLIIGIDGVAQ